MGPAPPHELSQRESSQRGQGPCGDWKALHPWRSSSEKHGHHPLLIPSFQRAAGSTFLERQLFSWGSQDGEGKPQQHPESAALKGEQFAHRLYSFFYQLLNQRRPQRLGPSASELPPRQSQRQSRPGRQPRPLPGIPRGAQSPQVRAGEKQPSSLHLFCFPFAVTQSPRRGRPGTPAPHSPGSLCGVVDRRRHRPRAA